MWSLALSLLVVVGQAPTPPGDQEQRLLGSRTEVVEPEEVHTVLHTAEGEGEEGGRHTALHPCS